MAALTDARGTPMGSRHSDADEGGRSAKPARRFASAGGHDAVADAFRAVIDALPVLAWSADEAGVIDYFNRPLAQYVGVTEDVSFDQAWRAALHVDDVDRVADFWRVALRSGQPNEIEARLRRHDGMHRWHLVRCDAQRDRSGRFVRWYGTNTDIEDRRNAELAAREKEISFRGIVDSIPGLVFTTSASGETDFINQPLLDYFGRSLDELKGWVADGTIHPDDVPRVLDHWPRALQAGEPSEIELRLRRADGVYRWFQYRAIPARDGLGDIVRWCVLATDIEDLKRAEEVLRATQARLSRAMQAASLSELSASIAHEINQPLAAVLANGHASRRWLSSDPPNVDRALLSAERIIRDGAAAADVVTRMRNLFTRAPPARQRLGINELIGSVCELMIDELRCHGVTLRLDLAPDLRPVAVDRVQMQQVLANLLRNAAEAMAAVEGRERTLTVSSRVDGATVVVRVADCGIGVGDPQGVFESFYTTKPDGMGMGLAICRSIVEAHGGRIWAEPNAPHGAVFAFSMDSAAG